MKSANVQHFETIFALDFEIRFIVSRIDNDYFLFLVPENLT